MCHTVECVTLAVHRYACRIFQNSCTVRVRSAAGRAVHFGVRRLRTLRVHIYVTCLESRHPGLVFKLIKKFCIESKCCQIESKCYQIESRSQAERNPARSSHLTLFSICQIRSPFIPFNGGWRSLHIILRISSHQAGDLICRAGDAHRPCDVFLTARSRAPICLTVCYRLFAMNSRSLREGIHNSCCMSPSTAPGHPKDGIAREKRKCVTVPLLMLRRTFVPFQWPSCLNDVTASAAPTH